MAQTLSQKLKIKEGTEILLVNQPKGVDKMIGPLPKGCRYVEKKREHVFLFWFVNNQAELKKGLPSVMKLSAREGLIWVAYPKITSGIQTDLTRDSGWEVLLQLDLTWKSMISLNETWTAFCMQNKPASNEVSKASEDYHSNVAAWCDPVKKIVKIPKDLEAAMIKGKVKIFFDELNFTNRKEYVLWIVGAKQEKTRIDRISKAVEKMKNGMKNPTMK